MLRILIQMVPQGMEGDAYELGRAEIWNDCKGSATKGDYGARLRGGYVGWGGKGIWKRGQVMAFPRKARGAWDLLYRALGVMIGDRNPAPAGSVLGAAVAALNGRAAVESVRIVAADLRAAYTDEYPAHKATAELCADVLLAAAQFADASTKPSEATLDNVPLEVVETLLELEPLELAGLLAHVAAYIDPVLGGAAAALLRAQLKGKS